MFYKYNMLSLLLLFIDIQNCDNFHCTCYEEAGSEIYFRTCSVLGKTICKLLSMCGSPRVRPSLLHKKSGLLGVEINV